MEFDARALSALSGLVLGVVVGFAARLAEFCTLGAIADVVVMRRDTRWRAWLLCMAVAIAVTQLAVSLGLIDPSRSIYTTSSFAWLGAILGGALFGFGMALIGTCGFGMLLRLGGGDLKALIGFATLGIVGFATVGGLLALPRMWWIEPFRIDFDEAGSQTLPALLASLVGADGERWRLPLALLAAFSLSTYACASRRLRSTPSLWLAATVIGLSIAAGWLATGWLAQDPFEIIPVVSFTFVVPLGDSVLYLMAFTGSRADFSIASVAGVLIGALAASLNKGEFRLEAFDDEHDLLRHLGGAALMGMGGVMAMGCTIGQGMSAVSTLALSAPIVVASIFAGATLGLRYLEEGNLWRAALVTLGRD